MRVNLYTFGHEPQALMCALVSAFAPGRDSSSPDRKHQLTCETEVFIVIRSPYACIYLGRVPNHAHMPVFERVHALCSRPLETPRVRDKIMENKT